MFQQGEENFVRQKKWNKTGVIQEATGLKLFSPYFCKAPKVMVLQPVSQDNKENKDLILCQHWKILDSE